VGECLPTAVYNDTTVRSNLFSYRFVCVFSFLMLLGGCRSASTYIERGDALFGKGEFGEASLNYSKAIQKDPNNGEAYFRLAHSQLKENKYPDAFRDLMQAVHLMPDNKTARAELEDLALTSYIGDPTHPKVLYDLLVKWSDEWLKKDPRSPEGLRIKGYLAILEKRPGDAADLFLRAHQANPKDIKLSLGLIDALYRNNQAAAAEKVGLDLVDSDKSAGEAYDALYRLYLATKRPSDAENILIRKVRENPKQNAYVMQLAVHYAVSRKKPEMEQAIQTYLKNAGGDPKVRMQVGDFYAALGDWPRALQQYNAGMAADPKQKQLYRDRVARALLSENKRDEALIVLNDAIAQNRDDKEAETLRAALLLAASTPAKAAEGVKAFKELVDKSPDDIFLKYVYSKALLEQKDLTGARTELLEVVKKLPHFKDAQVTLADIAFTQGNMSAAVEHATAALQVTPDSFRAQLLRASALIQEGDLEAASSALAGLSQQAPQSVEVRLASAVLELRKQKFAEAEAAFKKILAENPNDVRALSGLVDTELAENRQDKAFDLLNQELQRSHGAPRVRELLASTALRTGRYSVAIENLQRLAEQDHVSIDSQIELALVYRLKGEIRNAIATLRNAAILQPKDPRPGSLLPVLLELDNKKQEAKDICRRNLTQRPGDIVSMNNLAFLLADTGDSLDEALRFARQAVNKAPDNPAFADTLGYVYLKKDQNDAALEIFDRLVRKNPSDPTFAYHLGLAWYQKGDLRQAKDTLSRTLQLVPPPEIETGINDLTNRMALEH
jgi:tetratricopeptide (TPR) repeat protein